jgi:hypothetical protein
VFCWHFDGVAVRFGLDGDVVTILLCHGRNFAWAWHGMVWQVVFFWLPGAFSSLPLIAEAFDCFEVYGIPRHLS